MKIESAQFVQDDEGTNIAIKITHDGGQTRSCPVDGGTWMNVELASWTNEPGNVVTPADPQGA